MRHPLLMFEEIPEWDDLEVRVVIEVDGDQVEGRARGTVVEDTRLGIVAKASLAAAERAAGREIGGVVGISLGEVASHRYVVAVIVDALTGDPLVGSAPLRHFEDDAQGVIRAVFDAVNRRLGGPTLP